LSFCLGVNPPSERPTACNSVPYGAHADSSRRKAAVSSTGLSEISRIKLEVRLFEALAGFQKKPAVVFLDSPGGECDDQHPDRLLIQKHRFSISTAVADYALCASGCSLTWLAGKDRFTGTGARVGFHAARLNDTSSEIASGANAVVRRHAPPPALSPSGPC